MMVEIEFKSEDHVQALNSLRELFQTAMNDGADPDIFMEACLSYALAYHLQFSDKDSLDRFIENAKQNMFSPEDGEEIICH